MRRDSHSAEHSSNGKQAFHFPRNSIENVIAKALAIALEHEHANECEGSPVKSTSEPKFAHACAKSVLQFAFKIKSRIANENQTQVRAMAELAHMGLITCRILQSKRRAN